MATTYYGDKIRYNGTLIQSGGGSSYPIISLGTRLGDNGFKVSGSSGFIRKVETSTVADKGWQIVYSEVSEGYVYFMTSGNAELATYKSFKASMSVGGTKSGIYLQAEESHDGWRTIDREYIIPLLTTGPKMYEISNGSMNNTAYFQIVVRGGAVYAYSFDMVVWSGLNWTGTSKLIYSFGKPYVEPSIKTITNTYYV